MEKTEYEVTSDSALWEVEIFFIIKCWFAFIMVVYVYTHSLMFFNLMKA